MGKPVMIPVNRNGEIVCSRCGETANPRSDEAIRGWDFVARGGYIVGYICPGCKTPAETIETEVNLATVEYGTDDEGRLIGRPRI